MTTRLKYVVASLVVLQGYHRLGNEDFIIRSFHGHDAPITRGKTRGILSNSNKRPRRQLGINHTGTFRMETPENKTNLGGYNVGEWCPYCTYDVNSLCIDRVKYLVEKYKISEEEAKRNKAVASLCMMPPMPHRVFPKEKDEPSMILHVGPHKTGTTALQAFMYDLIYKNETIFVKDNLRVPSYDELPGVFGKEGVGLNLPHCSIKDYSGTANIGMCDRMRKEFPKFLMEAYNNSQDILIVAEDFDRKELNYERMRFFMQPYKRVKIAVTYRRLHDWLPSYYNQIIDHYLGKYAQGEDYYPSIVEWLNGHYDEFLDKHAVHVAERFRHLDVVESVDILNMHQIPDLIEHFFCKYLWSNTACQAFKDGAKPSKSNVGSDHEYSRIIIKAFRAGKIKSDMTRPLKLDRATRRLVTGVKQYNITLPRICPPKELLNKILETEIKQERAYFPKWYESQGGDEGLRQTFEKAAKKKLCSYDVENILETGVLQPVFKDIDASQNLG